MSELTSSTTDTPGHRTDHTMDELTKAFITEYAKPMPAPVGVSNREIVKKAVRFENPPRVPYCFSIPFESDFFETAVVRFLFESEQKNNPAKGELYYDEWGVGQIVTGRGHDQSCEPPLDDLGKLSTYQLPDLASPSRFEAFKPMLEHAVQQGKFVLADDPINLYERSKQLVGFEKLMVSFYTDKDAVKRLLSGMTDLMLSIIDQWAAIGGIDGFMTWDDWGLQTGLQISPEMFREFFRPFYRKIADRVHDKGMLLFLHSCGDIFDIIEDLIEIGIDVLQLDQPRLMGHQRLSDTFGGRICFWNTVDIQWSVADERTESEIRDEVKKMISSYHRFNGGLIARHYPQPDDIHLSHERNWAIYNAFMDMGCR